MNNIAAGYFTQYHGLSPAVSGVFASCFGLMNICMRSLGGLLSDWSNARYGMRGRLWSTWIVQSLEGALCIVLGLLTTSMKSPYEFEDDSSSGCEENNIKCIMGWTKIGDAWKEVRQIKSKVDGSFTNKSSSIPFCGSLSALPSDAVQVELDLPDELIMLLTPPSKYTTTPDIAGGSDCISNQDMAGTCLAIMILFSVFVQAAEGLHYGVVPYVSRPALGVVSGMVGAGGSLGSVIALSIFFSGSFRDDLGLAYMGIYILAVTSLLFFVYLPDLGGMLLKPGAIKYNPQLIKPPAGYLGADVLNLDGLKTADKEAAAPKDVQLTSTAAN